MPHPNTMTQMVKFIPSNRLLSVCRLRAVLVIIFFYPVNCIYNTRMVEVRWFLSGNLRADIFAPGWRRNDARRKGKL